MLPIYRSKAVRDWKGASSIFSTSSSCSGDSHWSLVIHILNAAYVNDSQWSSIFSIPRTWVFFVIHVLNVAFMILICHPYAQFREHYPYLSSMFTMPRTWSHLQITNSWSSPLQTLSRPRTSSPQVRLAVFCLSTYTYCTRIFGGRSFYWYGCCLIISSSMERPPPFKCQKFSVRL